MVVVVVGNTAVGDGAAIMTAELVMAAAVNAA